MTAATGSTRARSAVAAGTRRLGVFGGSFDPPHLGHLEIATVLLDHGFVDEVRVVPVFEHPFGKAMAPFADRLEMCRIAFLPLAPRVRVSAIERDLGGKSFTVRTLEHLHHDEPGWRLYLIVGKDALRERDHWKDFARVRELATPLVVPRAGEGDDEDGDQDLLPIPPPRDVSSTEVRRRLARGEPVADLVSPLVVAYLTERSLYRSTANGATGDPS